MTTLERTSSAASGEALAGAESEAAWLARRAAALERLARRQWEESQRARRPRSRVLAATARQLHAEAQRLAAATVPT